ncbi:MAG TPA: OmpH family outer membrane protein [Chitinophagaceae bacterium]|nr:OmpH family outer membrane protein [Chitinophagaceae bacterium]
MNKIKFLFLAAFIIATGSSALAQKAGYISVDDVVRLMPDIGKIDTVMQRYQADSINTEFASLVADYNYRDSILSSKDTLKMPATVRDQHRQALQQISYQVQNWQQIAQQAFQSKQQELLAPVYRKVIATINTVAKENGYAYVYTRDALIVAPPADDLLPLVAKKLNIKIPTGAPSAAAVAPKK